VTLLNKKNEKKSQHAYSQSSHLFNLPEWKANAPTPQKKKQEQQREEVLF